MDQVLGKNKRIMILDTIIDVLTVQETISLVDIYIQKKIPLHLMGVNADKINTLSDNKRLKDIVNGCGIINADGASVVLASKLLKKPLPERVAGIDLMQKLIALSACKGYSIYLLGARQEIIEKTAEVLQNQYANLKIAGIHNGYFEKKDWCNISEELKEVSPDIIFVGITSPLKEYIIDYLQNEGNYGVFMGVGGSFDVISGNIPDQHIDLHIASEHIINQCIQ
jgi:N-acetylglucosaminyldiphosphoundecaprenol N-acetyl-beta-D-mannosaminyltransferase